MSEVSQLESALDLLRRLPPQRITENLLALIQLLPEHTQQLLNTVDVPLEIRECTVSHREYLATAYNRSGDGWKSPWTSKSGPDDDVGDEEDGKTDADKQTPLSPLSRMERLANEAFATYKAMYFDGGVSSAYFWDMAPTTNEAPPKDCIGSFGAAIVIKNNTSSADNAQQHQAEGSWDSIHIVEADTEAQTLQVTTTILIHLNIPNTQLGGSLTKQSPKQPLPPSTQDPAQLIATIGSAIEQIENAERNSIQEIYFGKTLDIVNMMRPLVVDGFLRHQADLQKEMANRLLGMKQQQSKKRADHDAGANGEAEDASPSAKSADE